MTKNIGAFVVALALVALPSFAQAATYAYVNQSGNVAIVIANTPESAIATALNIHIRSGVILLNTANTPGVAPVL